MSEASYAGESWIPGVERHVEPDPDRYEALQGEHPEWHLPDISNPRSDYRDSARRDQAISYASWMTWMSDLRNRRIDELADVADIAGKGALAAMPSRGMPGSVALPPSGVSSALVTSPLKEMQTFLKAPDGLVDGARLARELGLGVKNGARLSRMDGDLVPAMGG